MTACIQCGSIRVRVIGGGPLQRVLALLLGQQVVVCGRCGWKGRQPRASRSGAAARRHGAAGRSAPEAAPAAAVDLEALDRALEPQSVRAPEQREGK